MNIYIYSEYVLSSNQRSNTKQKCTTQQRRQHTNTEKKNEENTHTHIWIDLHTPTIQYQQVSTASLPLSSSPKVKHRARDTLIEHRVRPRRLRFLLRPPQPRVLLCSRRREAISRRSLEQRSDEVPRVLARRGPCLSREPVLGRYRCSKYNLSSIAGGIGYVDGSGVYNGRGGSQRDGEGLIFLSLLFFVLHRAGSIRMGNCRQYLSVLR